MPELQAIWEDYRSDGLQIIAVDLAETLQDVLPFARDYDYMVLMDEDYSTWNLYSQLGYIPLNYVLDDDVDQTVVGWMEGFDDALVRSWIDTVIMAWPKLRVTEFSIVDSLGNDDGRADPGETVEMVVDVYNFEDFHQADSVMMVLRTGDPMLVVSDSVAYLPNIPDGVTMSNADDPFDFTVMACSTHWADFEVFITAQPNDYERSESLDVLIGRPRLIVVDDDEGTDYEEYYFSALDQIGIIYDCSRWVTHPPPEEIGKYETVIWLTGDDSLATLSQDDIDSLSSFLDGGGNLLISGQNIGDDIGGTTFYSDYLHAQFIENSPGNYFVVGVDGDEIGDGLRLMISGAGGASNQTSPEIISPLGGADSAFVYTRGGTAALKYESSYKVVYFAFGLEAINDLAPASYTDRAGCLAGVLSWFGYPVTGVTDEIGVRALESSMMSISPDPFRERTSIRFELTSPGWVDLKVYNLLGQEVRHLIGEHRESGSHLTTWDGTDDWGVRTPGGVYFLRLEIESDAVTTGGVRSPEYTETKKVCLVR